MMDPTVVRDGHGISAQFFADAVERGLGFILTFGEFGRPIGQVQVLAGTGDVGLQQICDAGHARIPGQRVSYEWQS